MRITLELPEDIAQGTGNASGRTCLAPRWKAWHLKHTGPMRLRPLSFAGCSASKRECR
jgi:hypothetical protein